MRQASDAGRHDRVQRGMLRRIDPFCWFAVGSLAFGAAAVWLASFPLLGTVLLLAATILAGFDLWIHRPRQPS